MFKNKSIAKVETLKKKPSGPYLSETMHMTVQGAVAKTFILTALMLCTFVVGFLFPNSLYLIGGAIAAFVVYLFTGFKPHLAGTTAPLYALIQGLFLGTVSAIYASMYAGILFQAFSLTIACLLAMLMLYQSGLIKVTPGFRAGVMMAVTAVMIVYIIAFVGYFVGFEVPFLHNSGPLGIGISVVIIGIACMNLLLDFDNFEKGELSEAPKYMEWYFAMGLLFTLIWLYLELLRLLSKLRD